MGAKQSSYRRAVLRHEQAIRATGCLFTDDVLSGDMVLICENVSTGLRSNGNELSATHAVLNPDIVRGVQRSQLGRPAHLPHKDISGFNRCGIVVCDRLGDKFVLEATARGVESTRLHERVAAVQRNGGVIAIRQVDAPEGRKFGRGLLKIFESTKDGPFTWDQAQRMQADMAAGRKVDLQFEMTAKLCSEVLRRIKHSSKVLSPETKAELERQRKSGEVRGTKPI